MRDVVKVEEQVLANDWICELKESKESTVNFGES